MAPFKLCNKIIPRTLPHSVEEDLFPARLQWLV